VVSLRLKERRGKLPQGGILNYGRPGGRGGERGREMAATDMFRELWRSLRKRRIGYLYSRVVRRVMHPRPC